jgi:exosortase/archaeosortase family protein
MGERTVERRALVRFLVRGALITALLYGVLYFPYRSETVVVRALAAYLGAIARAAAAVIGLFDASAHARGTTIDGRFPLQIVLDCSAVDAQALFVGAVLAFPARWQRRVAGALAGIAGLNLLNLVRIVTLYFVGVHWPTAFHTLHEEVIQIVLVLAAAGGFAAWAVWARVPAAAPPQAAPAEG